MDSGRGGSILIVGLVGDHGVVTAHLPLVVAAGEFFRGGRYKYLPPRRRLSARPDLLREGLTHRRKERLELANVGEGVVVGCGGQATQLRFIGVRAKADGDELAAHLFESLRFDLGLRSIAQLPIREHDHHRRLETAVGTDAVIGHLRLREGEGWGQAGAATAAVKARQRLQRFTGRVGDVCT